MMNRDWDWSWNDLRECQKLWGGLCILYRTYTVGEAPPLTTIQNTQASRALPRVFDTPSRHSNFNSNSNPNLNSQFTKFNASYPTCHLPYLSLKAIDDEMFHLIDHLSRGRAGLPCWGALDALWQLAWLAFWSFLCCSVPFCFLCFASKSFLDNFGLQNHF